MSFLMFVFMVVKDVVVMSRRYYRRIRFSFGEQYTRFPWKRGQTIEKTETKKNEEITDIYICEKKPTFGY